MYTYIDDDCKISLGELVVDKTSTTSKVKITGKVLRTLK